MIRKVIGVLVIFGMFLISLQSVSALNTYVGVKILNLTDDPTASCAGVDANYGSQGRIRGLSSILPDYPIYFNLSYAVNGTEVWSGNTTEDIDYGVGDTIYLPQLINIQSGINYNLFMDIDAVKIYLPLVTANSFEATLNDEYWTAGRHTTSSENELMQISNSDLCTYKTYASFGSQNLFFASNNRSTVSSSCIGDSTSDNCDEDGNVGLMERSSSACCAYNNEDDFLIFEKYHNLYQSTSGNINIAFSYP